MYAFQYTALIKDTLNKGHLCIKDTFQCTNLYSGNTFLPLKEDEISILESVPMCLLFRGSTVILRFCSYHSRVDLLDFSHGLSNGVLVPGNGDLVLHEGERGDVHPCPCLLRDLLRSGAVRTRYERVEVFVNFQSFKCKLCLDE